METIDRFLTSEKQSFFLLGPRGTGKSTYIKKAYPDALYIDLLPDVFRSYSARPERLREAVNAQKGKKTIIVDEIQKVPQLREVVHSLIEEKRGNQFIMTGSSSRKLRRAGVNLLAGRALMRRMHPFIAAELGSRFDPTNALKNRIWLIRKTPPLLYPLPPQARIAQRMPLPCLRRLLLVRGG